MTDAPATQSAELRVTSPHGTTVRHRLDGTRFTIGRVAPDHAPDIALDPDPQRWVGRLHCTLDLDGEGWSVTDSGSVNGTLLLREGSAVRVQGQRRLRAGDRIRILGDMTADQHPRYWTLELADGSGDETQTAPPFQVEPHLRYDFVSARAYRVDADGSEAIIRDLSPMGHQLLRFMAGRSRGSDAVACEHAELITALWGEKSEWEPHQSYTKGDLAGVVFAVRQRIEVVPGEPLLLETVPRIGYRLHVRVNGVDDLGHVEGGDGADGSGSPGGSDGSDGASGAV